MRRALGYQLKKAERLLTQFVAYLEDLGEEKISTERSLAWATLPEGAERGSWGYYRLSVVRGFATHLQAIDPATEVPAAGLLPRRRPRTTPYIYSDAQIVALIGAAGILRGAHHAATFRTLIGLLAVTGMRIGEAIGLDRDDVDSQAGLIVVRDTKFGKSRELVLQASAIEVLGSYLRRPDRPRPAVETGAVFVSTTGARLSRSSVHQAFHRLLARAGIEPRSVSCRPRLHDYADIGTSTTCAIASPCARSSTPTAAGMRSRRASRLSPPISGTSTRPRRIGIYRLHRS